jgi:hypothetical protein
MTHAPDSEPEPQDPTLDVRRILRALRQGVQEALLRHKQAGHPVAVWRDGRVQWLGPDEIPAPEPGPVPDPE